MIYIISFEKENVSIPKEESDNSSQIQIKNNQTKTEHFIPFFRY